MRPALYSPGRPPSRALRVAGDDGESAALARDRILADANARAAQSQADAGVGLGFAALVLLVDFGLTGLMLYGAYALATRSARPLARP